MNNVLCKKSNNHNNKRGYLGNCLNFITIQDFKTLIALEEIKNFIKY